ncbi:hypothetical protein DM02DRAFT_544632 [Periconia macrospinosa]|uniref:Uncharacterized protein n=1 Tax=Periconia macrospinosa TaxID=97972 RepID=A0A2V1D1Y0_9PLEO|nr:hypothetical protein DM02DRAFT_544632 [Periconia macrospinosa]
MGADRTRWWIEHGGRTKSGRGLFECPEGWPGAATFRILLDQFGIEWFQDSGALQLAVKNHDFETVKMLVEAGADINENVSDWNEDVREPRAAPLRALEMAVYSKSKGMIQYFAERGAKLPRKTVDDPWNTLPKEYRMYMDLVAELGAVEEGT